MNKLSSVVIVGGGLAGANSAFELRRLGFAGRVSLVSEEIELPYERPPLSKSYLRGEQPRERAHVRPAADYEQEGVELLRGVRAVTLNPESRELNLYDGTNLTYDALILATGAAPRYLRSARAQLAGVHHLRDVGDADRLRAAAASATSIAVIGGGWIGSEVAASLRQLGHEVILISSLPRPLERVLGPEVAETYRQVHLEHGVRLVQGRVASLGGKEDVRGVRLADGRTIRADLVVVGIGSIPRIGLVTRAGLETLHGAVKADEFLRTSVPNIYAAGDVVAAWHPRFSQYLHVEHWDNAIRQGKTAAANALGAHQPYTRTPYFYSDQFELGMEYRGYAPEWGKVVIRGDVRQRAFEAFWIADSRVIGAMNVNLWDDGKELRRLVESEQRVDLNRLADPGVPLADAA
ncbi:MAG: FAD-dependent oxidoreductase [Chloroflexota bacterium]